MSGQPPEGISVARRIAPAQLDLLQMQMWQPDDVRSIDGWLVRRSRGITKRANSVLPHGTPQNVDMAIMLAEQLYRAQGIAPCFQLTPSALPGDLDRRLADRGYERIDEVRVMVADIDDVLARLGERNRPVHAAGSPDVPFARLSYGTPERAAVMQEIGARTPSVYASMRRDGVVYAAGRGALADGWLGLFELVTHESARRQGLAQDVIGELVRRGRGGGARAVVLQVLVDNDPAARLYEKLGFTDHSRYHYRVLHGAPTTPSVVTGLPPMVPLGGPAPAPPTGAAGEEPVAE